MNDEEKRTGAAAVGLVPAGWKLAPGWHVAAPGEVAEWKHCSRRSLGPVCEGSVAFVDGYARRTYPRRSCGDCAVELGALVRDEPPAPRCCVCGDDDTYPTSNGRRYCVCCRCERCGLSPPDGNTCLCDYVPTTVGEPPAPAVGTLSGRVRASNGRGLATLADEVASLDARLARAKSDAQRAIVAATESLTTDASDLRTKLAQAEAQLAETEQRRFELSGHAAELTRERDDLRTKLAAAESVERHLREDIASMDRLMQPLHDKIADLESQLAQADAGQDHGVDLDRLMARVKASMERERKRAADHPALSEQIRAFCPWTGNVKVVAVASTLRQWSDEAAALDARLADADELATQFRSAWSLCERALAEAMEKTAGAVEKMRQECVAQAALATIAERDDSVAKERVRVNGWWLAWYHKRANTTRNQRDEGIRSGKPAPGTK